MIGFLKKMLKKNKKIERDDPVFGGIELEHAHGIDMWWHLPSDDKDHMVVIYASSTGPSQAQRNFYDTLRRDIVSLEATCKEFISRQQDIPPNLSDMRIYSIEIGENQSLKMVSSRSNSPIVTKLRYTEWNSGMELRKFTG